VRKRKGTNGDVDAITTTLGAARTRTSSAALDVLLLRKEGQVSEEGNIYLCRGREVEKKKKEDAPCIRDKRGLVASSPLCSTASSSSCSLSPPQPHPLCPSAAKGSSPQEKRSPRPQTPATRRAITKGKATARTKSEKAFGEERMRRKRKRRKKGREGGERRDWGRHGWREDEAGRKRAW
jgi:hypothetical protein